MKFPSWRTIADIAARLIGQAPAAPNPDPRAPDSAVPADARRELDIWDGADLDSWRRGGGGQAPPEAPHIPEDDTI